ncbi:MAG: FkbM family methyltransferase [Planctomycetaceae bacterium]
MSKLITYLKKSRLAMLLRKPCRKVFCRLADAGLSSSNPLWFSRDSTGIVHVGAHAGQEAWIYVAFGKPVIWIEPNPIVMTLLREIIRKYPKQQAVQALITDRSNVETAFHISNCHGGSSSIFDLGGHQQMYPGVIYEQTIPIRSTTLDDALSRIPGSSRQNALVMDVQGAEVVVPRGATKSLRQFKWFFAECADFEIYRNGCT